MRTRDWLIIALIVVLAVAGLQTMHTVRHAIRMHFASGPLKPWMSIPYIARTHHVPAPVLYEAIGLPAGGRDRRPIVRIARQQGRPVGELIASLDAAIAQARAHAPPHPTRSVP